MANYLIQPKADYDADSNDVSNALLFLGVPKPATISGLTNGTEYIAREFVLSPPSESFIPEIIPGINYTITVVGLIDGEARQGEEISLSIDPAITTETVTYQWQANGSDIDSATTATEVVDIGGVHTDGQSLRCVVTIDGEVFVSNAAPMRYAPGTLSIADQSAWTVDDTAVSFSIAPSGTGLTFSNFQISDVPAALSVDGSGDVTGTVTFANHQAASSGTGTGLCQDQYGRSLSDTFDWSSQLRPAMVAGIDLELSFPEGSAITPVDLLQNWSLNGNTPQSISFDSALPAGLSAAIDGTEALLSGTPSSVTVNASRGFTVLDEYGRETSDTFMLEITEGFTLTETAEGEMEIDGATGEVTVTVTSPAAYANYDAGNGAGVFIFASADLASGPVNLVPPQIVDDGTPSSGEELMLTPGLWVYDPDVGGIGTPSYQWQADAAGNGTFADISGATSAAYTLTSSESGDDVLVIETQPQTNISPDATATSAAVSVASGTAAINSITPAPGGGLIVDYTGTLTVTPAPGGGVIMEVA